MSERTYLELLALNEEAYIGNKIHKHGAYIDWTGFWDDCLRLEIIYVSQHKEAIDKNREFYRKWLAAQSLTHNS